MDISDSLTTIDVCAFYSCEWLTSIDLPDSLTTIGEFAFSDCDNLTSMVVPDSVTSIGMGAFDSCRNLTLHCYEDSYAHRYAVDNYKAYELIKRLIPGDADGNNEVNFSDVICILKHIAKWDVSLNNDAADVTGDDTINLSDVTLLMQYIAEWDVVWG